MAHFPLVRCAGLLFAGSVLSAGAAVLGDVVLESAPGAPLRASVPVALEAGEAFAPECIFLSRGPAREGPFVTRAQIVVEGTGAQRIVRISASGPTPPRAKLRVVLRCAGQVDFSYREYASISLPTVAAAPSTDGAKARSGDSLGSIATAIFPRDPAARAAYVEALRLRNPDWSTHPIDEPLPAGAALAFPDLKSLPRPPPTLRRPPETRAPPPRKPAKATAEAPTNRQEEVRLPPVPRAAVTPSRDVARSAGSFVLRLSTPTLDLSRSQGLDDASRAKLRARQLVLDADDQVAAFLALRDNVRRLESRVEELQLRLSRMPTAPAAPPAAALPSPAIVERPAPVAVPAPLPVPAPSPTPATAATTPAAPVAAATPQPPAPVAATPPAAQVPATAAVASPRKTPAGSAQPVPPAESSIPWLWIALGLAAVLALAGFRAWMRSRAGSEEPETEDEEPEGLPVSDVLPLPERNRHEIAEAPAVAPRREMTSDAGLATGLSGGEAAGLRRRYIEERFPEIAKGAIVPGNPDSVVKSARLFYEDGAISRATELLQYCTEEDPGSPRPWLALFEIYRLERMAREYGDLAQRFKEHHVKGGHWRKVQFFGREIDPGNTLYRDLSVGIETIAFQSGKPPVTVVFDPVAENWLDAPMDFENEVLASALRRALLAEAKIAETDLVPNPMPALRSVDMFTVA